MARGQNLRTALTGSVCAIGEESPKDSLVWRFGVSKGSFAYSEFYSLYAVRCGLPQIRLRFHKKFLKFSKHNIFYSMTLWF